MSVTFERLSKKPLVFSRLLGISVDIFIDLLNALKPVWEKEIIKK
jgi:hypothetical protein